jgi:hypothetical protein
MACETRGMRDGGHSMVGLIKVATGIKVFGDGVSVCNCFCVMNA